MSESVLMVSAMLVLLCLAAGKTAGPRVFRTRFERAENPISEGGLWLNGQKDAVDWADVRTTPGFAYGLELGTNQGAAKYDDAAALLTGPWAPDQMAQATVRSVNQTDKLYEEVELRLRSELSPHQATGYEILFRCLKTKEAYLDIVRWNGPLGDFTYLNQARGEQYGVATGDVVKATMIGNVITAYINGVQVLQATDDTFKSGSPGMGFFLEGGSGAIADYGFTEFEAAEIEVKSQK